MEGGIGSSSCLMMPSDDANSDSFWSMQPGAASLYVWRTSSTAHTHQCYTPVLSYYTAVIFSTTIQYSHIQRQVKPSIRQFNLETQISMLCTNLQIFIEISNNKKIRMIHIYNISMKKISKIAGLATFFSKFIVSRKHNWMDRNQIIAIVKAVQQPVLPTSLTQVIRTPYTDSLPTA